MKTLFTPLALAVLTLAVARPAPGMVVTGRGLAEIYVDVSGVPNLKPGDRLRVGEPASAVGELVIVRIQKGVAVCRVVSVRRPIVTGDKVSTTEPPAPAPPATPAPAPATVALAALRPSTPEPAPTPAPTPTPTPTPAPAPAPTPMPTPTPTPTPTPAPPPAPKPTPPPKAVAASSSTPATPPVPKPVATPGPTPAQTSPAVLAVAPPAVAVAAGTKFRVKYRSAGNVYLEGGRAQGLNVGDSLRVLAGQTTLAELEVVYVAEHSASCRVVSEARPVSAGDQVLHVSPRTAAPPATLAASVAPAAPTATPRAPALPAASLTPGGAWGRLRGGASFGYYRSWDETESAYDFQQRTGRVDLAVQNIASHPLSFTLRGRSRQDIRARTLSLRTPQNERNDRLYEVALRYEPPSEKLQFEVGRVGIYSFVGIGYLDGGIVRMRPTPSLQVGAFGGRTADYEGFGFASEGQKYGAFVRLAPGGRYAMAGYDIALAAVHESAAGDVSREYLSLESRFGSGSRWSLFQRAELDVNRGWRKELSGSGTQLSNVSLSGNLRVGRSANAFVSYDGRRNYRYYQNRIVPEEVFDDLLHQGLRAGVNVTRAGGFGATAGFGVSLKQEDPRHPELNLANAYSFNAGARHANLLGSGFSVGLDGSGFSNGYTDGGLVSARLGRRFAAGSMIDLSWGRSLYRIKLDEQERSTQWLRLVGRLEFTRHFFVVSDLEYDKGDDLQGPRVFFELGSVF